MKVLFLDDRQERIDVAEERYKDDDLTVVRTAEEAINHIEATWWNTICLDHDLDGEEFVDSHRKDCGMEVIRYLVDNSDYFTEMVDPMIIIHSSNPHAALEMYSKLKNFGYRVIYERFRYE